MPQVLNGVRLTLIDGSKFAQLVDCGVLVLGVRDNGLTRKHRCTGRNHLLNLFDCCCTLCFENLGLLETALVVYLLVEISDIV